DQIELRIVAAGAPERAALALRERYAIPGGFGRIAGPCDRMDAPELFAGFRIMSCQETAPAGVRRRASGNAGNHLSAYHQGTCCIVEPDSVIGNLDVPNDLPGASVQCKETGITGGEENAVSIQRNAVAGAQELASDVASLQLRQRMSIFPDQIASPGIERM